MKFNPDIHHRHSIRIKGYDYSKEGIYFITICTQNREKILAKIVTNNVGAGLVPAQRYETTRIGTMVEKIYLNLEKEFYNVILHSYIIMPNHIHGIIEICERAGTRPAPTLSSIIRLLKSKTTLMYIQGVKQGIYQPFNKRIWQRNYYEHIIRNEKEYLKIQEYINNNPLKWKDDKLNC